MRRAWSVLPVAVLLAGCAAPIAGGEERVQVTGDPEMTSPTNQYLKAHVATDAGFVTVAFDRRDWYVAGLEKELQRTDWLALDGVRGFTNEVVTDRVHAPEGFESRYRYDAMASSAEARARMDREWDARLAELSEGAKRDLTGLGRLAPGILA